MSTSVPPTQPSAESFATALRSHLAGSLRATHVGESVRLAGWVHQSRDLGGLVFLDLRDRDGIVQVSFDPQWASTEAMAIAAALGRESVVLVEGTVAARPETMRNPDMVTGDVEVRATSVRVLSAAATPAVPVARGKGERLPDEELRLKHRHLDLRRPELQKNLVLRHRLLQATRRYLSERGFLEIETPVLTKPTPEGARDYLVPSRVHPGEFYALPQSPQLYKQLLMVAGFDRYFQIARCFRDEDLRADRQPEFTQIDIEASFVEAEDIMALTEGMLVALFAEAGHAIQTPFARMTYADSMERFGNDRPDRRYGLELFDATAAFADADFVVTRNAVAAGGRVRGFRIPGGASLSNKQVGEIEAVAKAAGLGGLLRIKRVNGALEGPPTKFLTAEGGAKLGLQDGELCLLAAGPDSLTSPALDRVRQDVARRLELVPEGALEFLWVVDFPMFEKAGPGAPLTAVHHPFTSPRPDDEALLDSAPERARARAYDVVLNGTELGGGSIRISDSGVQQRIFSLLGIDEATADARFGFLLDGLRAGAPPHGGIALGFDRLAMMLSGATSLRDVIAFPKTTAARALFEGAPSPVPAADLAALNISVALEGE